MLRLAMFAGGLSVLLSGGRAAAQTPAERGFVPVEQRVDDLDPLARSQRQVQNGIGYDGRSSWVYRKPGDRDKLYYMRPGVTAEYDSRSEYVRIYDGYDRTRAIFQMIPSNTRFLIDPPTAKEPATVPREDPPQMVQARIDGHATAAEHAITTPPPSSGTASLTNVRKVQTESVLRAIDRAVAK